MFRKGGITIDSTNSNGTTSNTTVSHCALRERLLLAVYYASAFAKIDPRNCVNKQGGRATKLLCPFLIERHKMSELREYEVESNGEKEPTCLTRRDAAQMPGAVLVKAAEPKPSKLRRRIKLASGSFRNTCGASRLHRR